MANKIFVEPKQSADGTVLGFWALIAIDNGDGTYSLFIKDQPTSGAPAIAAAISSSGASPVIAAAGGGITGAGTANKIPKFTAAAVIGDSAFTQSSVPTIFPAGTLVVLNAPGLEVVQAAGSADMIGGTIRLGANGRMPGVPVPYDPNTPMPGELYVQHFAGLADFFTWQLGGLLQDGSGSRLLQASLVMDNTDGASNPTQGYLRLSASAVGKPAAYQKCGLDFNHIGIIQVLTAGVFQFTDVNESGAARIVLGPATNLFPSLVKSGLGFVARLGDDSADTTFKASQLTASGLTANSFLYSGVAGLLTDAGAPTNGQLLIGSTGAAPVKANLASADGSVVITNGAGSIDLSAPGGAVASIGARVNKSVAQSIADSTVVAVAFDQEQFDDGGCHDNAVNNSRLTVPAGKGGVYTISAAVRWAANAVGRRILSIRLNGVTTVGSVEQPVSDAANEARQTCSAIFRFVAGDFIEMTVFQNSTGALNVTNTSDGSWFAMERIAA